MDDSLTTTDIDTVADEVTATPKQKRERLWQDRKRTIVATLIFCALCIIYIMFQGKDLLIYQTIIYGCFGLAGSTIGFFIGGQTIHDINSEKIDAVQQIRQGTGPGPRINGPQGAGQNPGI